jgi:chromosome segregation ATPase
MGSKSRLREIVATARDLSDPAAELDEQKNLAYLARTATENILALERVVHEQERQLEERWKEAAKLQRNYETLSRVRQGDAKELVMLRAQRQQESDEVEQLREQLRAERSNKEALHARLAESEAALAQVTQLKLQVESAERKHAQAVTAAEAIAMQAADLKDANKTLRLGTERLSRAHTDLGDKLRATSDARSRLEREKDVLQRELGAAHTKLAHMEKQLRTFLEFNATMEGDLRMALAKSAELDKQCRELEFEKQTVEAYYTAKHMEMQAQFQSLLHTSTGGVLGE